MKKSFLILASAVCGFGLFAEKAVFPEHPTFLQVRNASLTPEKLQSIKSVRVICSVNGNNGDSGVFMIRAKRPDQIRLDLFDGEKVYSSIRNKDKYWYCDPDKGISNMSKTEIAMFEQDVAFLAVPLIDKPVFTDPVFVKEEKVRKEVRSVFQLKAKNGFSTLYTMSVDNATKQVKRVKITDDSDRVGYIVLYRNYEKVHGVEVPGNVLTIYANEHVKMTLCAADWNLQIDDEIFEKKKDMKDPDIVALSQYMRVEKDEKKEKELKKAARVSMAVQERNIRNLKMEIKELEIRIEKMEEVIAHNRESITKIASNDGSPVWTGSGSWRGAGWHRRGRRSRSDGRSVSRRTLHKISKDNSTMESDYISARDLLLKKRSELADAEILLQQIKGTAPSGKKAK